MRPCYPESPTAATYDGQDPSNGIVASSDVPLPTRLEIRNCPPSASTLSTNPMSPDPFWVGTTDSIVGNREAQVRTFSLDVYRHHTLGSNRRSDHLADAVGHEHRERSAKHHT